MIKICTDLSTKFVVLELLDSAFLVAMDTLPIVLGLYKCLKLSFVNGIDLSTISTKIRLYYSFTVIGLCSNFRLSD